MAAAIRTDPDHERCVGLFDVLSEPLLVPQIVLTEAAYLVGKILGSVAEASFVRQMADAPITFYSLEPDDLRRMADLMETYADFPLGTVDAAVIATAERFGATTVATLDRRHFTVVRPRHVPAFTLLP